MSGTGIPPGWYPIPDAPGWQRWWDGSQWTEATMPLGVGPTQAPPASGPVSPTPPSARRWSLLAAGGVGLLLIAVVAVVGIRWLNSDEVVSTPPGSDEVIGTPPGSGEVTQPTPETNAGTPTDRIPVTGDLAGIRVEALLPAEHNERGRQVLSDQDLVVLSHPESGQYVTISLLRADDGAVSVVDRQQLRCSYEEQAVGASGGAQLHSGGGVGYVTCEGRVESVIMDAEMTLPTRVWALEPGGSSLVVHPDPEQGWPTVGFQLGSGPGGPELVLPVCTDLDCSPEQYTYAVHVAHDTASQSFQAVACSEPGGPRTEMPGGPWDASDNPELTPPEADRGCGP